MRALRCSAAPSIWATLTPNLSPRLRAATLVIKGGSVYGPDGPVEADVHVTDGVITGVEAGGVNSGGATVIDARGMYVMPGAIDLLRSIPEGRWGVVTSGSRLLAANRLRHCGLPVPRVLVTADDVAHGKPHPEPYLKGAERLGFEPADCLVIEDAPAGIQAARAGGMKVIGITSTYTADALEHADAVIGKLGQIRITANEVGKLRVEAALRL